MNRWATALLAWASVLSLSAQSPAAYISEVDLTPRPSVASKAGQVTLPPLVEISALTGSQQIELVVLDAQDRTSTYGRIKQVVRLNVDPLVGGSNGTGVMLVTEPTWPAEGLNSVLPQAVAALPAGQPLDFGNLVGDSRTLLLLSSWSIWTPGAKFSATSAAMAGAQILDYVTFGPAISAGAVTRARSFAEEPVLDPALGSVIERPTRALGGPAGRTLDVIAFPGVNLSPPVDSIPVVTGYYPLTPGFPNPALAAAYIPEPTGLVLLALPLLAAGVMRRRR